MTAAGAHYLTGLEWRQALIVGAVVSSTDAAAVFSVLRRIPLPARITGTLEAESGFNDAPVVILVVAFSTAGPIEHWYVLLGEIALELAIGAAIGLAVGWLGSWGLRHVALPASGLYPIAVMSIAVAAAYAAGAMAHGSGFLAVYLASMVMGNARLPHWPATRGFADGLGWLAQIGMFVLLGLLVTPARAGGRHPARPGHRTGADHGGAPAERRAVPAAVPGAVAGEDPDVLGGAARRRAHHPGDHPHGGGRRRQPPDLQHRLRPGRRLHPGPGPDAALAGPQAQPGQGDEAADLGIESAPLERLRGHLLSVTIPEGSKMHGVEVSELRLPAGSAVTLVVREGKSFVPLPTTGLRRGDELLVVATDPVRDAAEARLRAVGHGGKLAGWLGSGDANRNQR